MRFQGRGLRSRIIWTTALVSLLAMGAVIGTAILALNAVTRGNVDTNLNDRFVLASEAIKDDPRGPKVALDTPLDSVEDSTWLFDGSGTQVLGPDAGRRVQGVVDDLGTVTKQTSLTKRGRVYLAGPVTIGGPDPGPGVLVVAQSLEPYDDTRTEILVGLVAMALLVTAGATGIAAWTMHRTLAPVESMASLAEDWSETDLDERFDGLGSQNEIAHLGHTLNLLLDRVAGALRGEQRLTAELAHELRTPLTGIRGEVELALMTERDPDTRARLDRVVLPGRPDEQHDHDPARDRPRTRPPAQLHDGRRGADRDPGRSYGGGAPRPAPRTRARRPGRRHHGHRRTRALPAGRQRAALRP